MRTQIEPRSRPRKTLCLVNPAWPPSQGVALTAQPTKPDGFVGWAVSVRDFESG